MLYYRIIEGSYLFLEYVCTVQYTCIMCIFYVGNALIEKRFTIGGKILAQLLLDIFLRIFRLRLISGDK